MLADQYSNREHLFARRAARHPNTDGVIRAASLEQLRYDSGLQRPERILIAKETGHIDQQVPEERAYLLRLLSIDPKCFFLTPLCRPSPPLSQDSVAQKQIRLASVAS